VDLANLFERPNAGERVVLARRFGEIRFVLPVQLRESPVQFRRRDEHRVFMEPQPDPVDVGILLENVIHGRPQDGDVGGMRRVGEHRAGDPRLRRHDRSQFRRMDAELEPDGRLDAASVGHFDDLPHQRLGVAVALFVGPCRHGAVGAKGFRAGRRREPLPGAEGKVAHRQRAVAPPRRQRGVEARLGQDIAIRQPNQRLNVRCIAFRAARVTMEADEV
jgi:hypothetical protein